MKTIFQFQTDGTVIIFLSGVMGANKCDTALFSQDISRAIEKKAKKIIIDMKQVTSMTSEGLGMLVLFYKEAIKFQIDFALRSVPSQAMVKIHTAQFEKKFEIIQE